MKSIAQHVLKNGSAVSFVTEIRNILIWIQLDNLDPGWSPACGGESKRVYARPALGEEG